MKGIVAGLVLLVVVAGAVVLGGAMLLSEPSPEIESGSALAQNINWSNDCQHRCENGVCNTIIGKTVWVKDTDGQCKLVEEATELTGYFEWVYLEQDPDYEIEGEGYNYTTIKKLKIKSEIEGNIPIKINDIIYISPYFEAGEELEIEDIEIDNIFAYNFTIGNASTTIQLQDADTENLDDAVTLSPGPQGSMDNAYGYFKFVISGLPGGQGIDDSELCAYSSGFNGWDGDMNVSGVIEEGWVETDTWQTLLGLTTFGSYIAEGFMSGVGEWDCLDVTSIVASHYENNRENASFELVDPDNSGTPAAASGTDNTLSFGSSNFFGWHYLQIWSKEYTGDTTKRPYLNITYSEAGDETPPDITFIVPTPNNDTNLSQNNYFVNVSISESASSVLLELTNTSGTINYTMTNEAGNWYNFNTSHSNNMTYFYVYASDTAGNLNRSLGPRFVNISMPAPPADNTTFNITLPLQTPVQSSLAGPATQPIEINFSTSTEPGINASVVSGVPQNNTYSIFQFKNAGDTAVKWIIELNESTPSCINLNGSWDSAASSVFSINTTTNSTVNWSIAQGEIESVWIFGDAWDCSVNDNAVVIITHYSQTA